MTASQKLTNFLIRDLKKNIFLLCDQNKVLYMVTSKLTGII